MKITWSQFKTCMIEDKGINYKFEDLCRQLFEYEFLSEECCGQAFL